MKRCDYCGRFMRLEERGGPNPRWECDECRVEVAAPEYVYLFYGLSKRELHDAWIINPGLAAEIQQERGPGRKAGEGCGCKQCKGRAAS